MVCIQGRPGAPGVAKGIAVVMQKQITADGRNCDPQGELQHFEDALAVCTKEMLELHERLSKAGEESEARIIKAYAMMLQDKTMIKPMKEAVLGGKSAFEAIDTEVMAISDKLIAMDNAYMRERADDIRHVGSLLKSKLNGEEEIQLPQEPFVLVAEDLTPVDTLKLDRTYLAGLVTQMGGATSHTVILAKTMGIPAIIGIESVVEKISTGDNLLLDGGSGQIIIQPDEMALHIFEEQQCETKKLRQKIKEKNLGIAATGDGYSIEVCCNIGSPEDMELVKEITYDGVGLFRTEFLYNAFQRYPTFDEQLKAYREVAAAADGKPVIIRTLDIGGDKHLPYLELPKEENPFLGYRAVRISLSRREMFLDQLSAILAAGDNVQIMFPMITQVRELLDCKELLELAKERLREKGIPYNTSPKVGIMVETPACGIMTDRFARLCDFMSIGTNDLTQYVTCADRNNPAVEELCTPYNPAMLRLLAQIANDCKKAGLPIGVCGELAGNMDYLPFLIGIGIDKLSVSPSSVDLVRFMVCSVKLSKMQMLAQQVLELDDPREIKNILSQTWKDIIK